MKYAILTLIIIAFVGLCVAYLATPHGPQYATWRDTTDKNRSDAAMMIDAKDCSRITGLDKAEAAIGAQGQRWNDCMN